MQQMATRPAATNRRRRIRRHLTWRSRPADRPVSPVGASPQKIFDAARGDYFAGQHDLAILGFADYVKSFPKPDMADDAQVNICSAYVADGKPDKAVEACDLAIRNYPRATSHSRGLLPQGARAQHAQGCGRRARGVGGDRQEISRPSEAGLARQGLERLKRP